MKPAAFDYAAPETPEEALEFLAEEGGEARIMAGGQSLIAMLNMRLASPGLVIDISRLGGLRGIAADEAGLTVGAAATQSELLAWPGLERSHPLLAKALPFIGHVQTRNKGTVCGSIAHADPSSELPLCLAVTGGRVTLAARGGRRELAAGDFQRGLMTTACAEDEMIERVHFPAPPEGAGCAFREFALRHGDFAIVAVAAVADGTGVTLGVGGVAEKPVVRRWEGLEEGSDLDDALNALAWGLGASDDQHASARFRRDLVRGLGRRAVEEARRCRN